MPVYYTVWEYLELVEIERSFAGVQDIAERAVNLSHRLSAPIKPKHLCLWNLFCFRGDILEEVLKNMLNYLEGIEMSLKYCKIPINCYGEPKISEGTKAAVLGEFYIVVDISSEDYMRSTPTKFLIPWTTCKEIYKLMVNCERVEDCD